MSIYVSDLRAQIIKPCLEALGDFSDSNADLLLGTATQESLLREQHYYTERQGLGIYRITSEKHRDVWDKYLIQFPELASSVRGFASQQQFLKNPHQELISNWGYATAIAWMIYKSNNTELGKTVDVNGLAQLWAKCFDNGTGCVRNAEEFISTYCSTMNAEDNHKLVA